MVTCTGVPPGTVLQHTVPGTLCTSSIYYIYIHVHILKLFQSRPDLGMKRSRIRRKAQKDM